MNLNDENGEAADDVKCILAEAKRRMKNSSRRRRRRKSRRRSKSTMKKLMGARKPKTKQKCNKHPCPFKWVPGEWSQVRIYISIYIYIYI